MLTRVIWRVREKEALQRCMKLAFPLAPEAENPPDALKAVASRFAADVTRFPDNCWTTLNTTSEPMAWRHGRIRIRFQFVPPTRVVRVLSVEVSTGHDGPYVAEPECNHFPRPAPESGGK